MAVRADNLLVLIGWGEDEEDDRAMRAEHPDHLRYTGRDERIICAILYWMTARPSIHPAASIGHVHLTVVDLPRTLRFYRDVLGFHEAWTDGEHTVFLSTDGQYPFHLGLTTASAARPSGRTAGLYHAAFLFPDRAALGRVFQRLRAQGVRVDGASDHLVSEALYLRDPEGNGLELYADRPRERWPRRNGQIMMASEPLDLGSLLAAAGEMEAWTGIPPETRLGHIHLSVSDLRRAEDFYHGVLGFDVTTRDYPGALFFSTGGYHHHLGVNIWAGTGLAQPPAGIPGLGYFTVALPDREELSRIVRHAERSEVPIEGAVDHGLSVGVALRDWDGIRIELTVDREAGRVPPGRWTSAPVEVNAVLRD